MTTISRLVARSRNPRSASILLPWLVIGCGAPSPPGDAARPVSVEAEVVVTEATSPIVRLSPDGGRIAFVVLGQPWVLEFPGRHARALADPETDPVQVEDLAWSPDGTRLAVSLWNHPSDVTVRIYDLRTGDFEAWRPPGVLEVLRWAPGGGSLLGLVREGPGSQIHRLSSDGTSSVETRLSGRVRDFDVSRDGARMAVAGLIAGEAADGLWVLDRVSGDWALLRESPGVAGLAFDPAGGRIAYRVGHGQGGEIRVMSVSGPNRRARSETAMRLDTEGRWIDADRPSWTPDGDALVYAAEGRIWRTRIADAGDGEAGRAAIAATEEIPFEALHRVRSWSGLRRPAVSTTDTQRRAVSFADPTLSPGADRVAFAALGDLWISDTAGTEVRRLTETPAHEHAPLWSPDGRWIAYRREAPGRDSEVRIVDPADGTSWTLPVPDGARIVWSPAGDRVAFLAGEELATARAGWLAAESGEVYPIPLDGLSPAEGSRYLWLRGLLGWTAEGDAIAVHLQRFDREVPGDLQYVHEVRLVDVESGETRPLPVPAAVPLRAAWSPGLAFGAFSYGGRAFVTRLAAGAEPSPLPDPYARDFAWSPDGRQLVYLDGGELRLHDRLAGRTRALPVEVRYTMPPAPPPVLIRAVRVLDGIADTLTGPRDVLLAGGRIERIEPAGSLTPGEGVRVVSPSRGSVLMPGLINTHVHLFPPPGGSSSLAGRRFLYFGTTTVRDLGTVAGWIVGESERVASGSGLGPRVIASVGHLERETGGGWPWKWVVDPDVPESVQAAMDAIARSGGDLVKVWLRDPSLAAAAPRAAHRSGLPVTSHYPYAASFAWGLDGKEHILDYYRRPVGPYRQDLLALLEAAGTCVTPTLLNPRLLNTPLVGGRLFPVSPEVLGPTRRLLRPSADSALAARFDEPMASEASAHGDSVLRLHLDNVRRLHEGEVLLATGTDAAEFDVRTDLEVRLLEAAGLTRAAAIRAATADAARCVGLEHELGTVDEGKRADLLLLRRNPLEDLEALEAIEWVVVGGELHRRSDLAEVDPS